VISGVSLSNQSHYPVAFIVLANSLKKCYDSGSYILVINSLSIHCLSGFDLFHYTSRQVSCQFVNTKFSNHSS